MNRRLGAAAVVVLTLIGAMAVVGAPIPAARAAPMCRPVTLDDLFPPPTQAPSPTSPPTTGPASPEPAPTGPNATATTTPVSSSTTVASTTTTTEPSDESTVTSTPGDDSTSTTVEDGEPAPTAPASPRQSGCAAFRYEMRWPLAGEGQLISGFGTDRDQGDRHHQGIDIAAPKLTPVVAVADGVVMKVVQEAGTEDCCWMSLRHDDGWQSYYIHLNNDQQGTDDGLGVGVRIDLAEGTEVAAGEVIGWVGDSGNAEESIDHLHFELRTSSGVAVDARASLVAAKQDAELADPQPVWPYADDEGLESEWLAASLVSQGLFLPCDETMTMFCPERIATPNFAAAIVAHFAGKSPPTLHGRYVSLLTPVKPEDVEVSAAGESGVGCNPHEECFDFGLPATEVARVAAWAHIDGLVTSLLPDGAGLDQGMPMVSLPSAEDAEERLRAVGAIESCNPPLDSHRLLTRGETLTLLAAWVEGSNPEPCSDRVQRVR
ncbi:MAG: peptidoglycan DD-metalloendopeptidase family protein [Acidimicrobiia bacterium]